MESVHGLVRRVIRIAEMPEASFRVQFVLNGESVELAAAYAEDRLGILVTEPVSSSRDDEPAAEWNPRQGVVRDGSWRIAVVEPLAGQVVDALAWIAAEMNLDVDVSTLDRAFDRGQRLSLDDEPDNPATSLLDQFCGSAGISSSDQDRTSDGIHRLLECLNKEQRLAVTASPDAHLLICAGAGTGKTEVIASRVLYLMATYEIPSDAIAVLTFSKGAVQALADRLEFLNAHYGIGLPSLPKVRTLHSFGLELVKRLAYTGDYWLKPRFGTVEQARVVKDDGTVITIGSIWLDNSKQLFEGLMDDLTEFERLEYYSSAIDCLRCGHPGLGVVCRPDELAVDGQIRIVSGIGLPVDLRATEVKAVFERYYRLLEEVQQIDYPAMVSEALHALRLRRELLEHTAKRLKVIIIDEFQDTSRAQEQLIRTIALGCDQGAGPFLNVVGDDDQTIFTFNGSDISNILEFVERNSQLRQPSTTSVTLRVNYRNAPGILDISGRLIRRNKRRIPKELESSRHLNPSKLEPVLLLKCEAIELAAKAISVQLEHIRSALDLRYSDCAILYRRNSQAFPQADIAIRVLGKAGIPVKYEVEVVRRWTPRLESLYRLCVEHRSEQLRVLQVIVEDALDASSGRNEERERWRSLRFLLQDYEREGFTTVSQVLEALEAVRSSDPPESDDEGVRVLSVHKAKGQEFRCVFVLFLAEKQFPDSRAEGLGIEEERRVLYVALTRGQDHVCVCGTLSLGEPDFFAELIDMRVPVRDCFDVIRSHRHLTKASPSGKSVGSQVGSGRRDDVKAGAAAVSEDRQPRRLLSWTASDLSQTSDSDQDVSAAADPNFEIKGDAETVSLGLEGSQEVVELEGSAKRLLETLKKKRDQIRKAGGSG